MTGYIKAASAETVGVATSITISASLFRCLLLFVHNNTGTICTCAVYVIGPVKNKIGIHIIRIPVAAAKESCQDTSKAGRDLSMELVIYSSHCCCHPACYYHDDQEMSNQAGRDSHGSRQS